MHVAAIHLVPVLAAEKSRTVFYIAAALLVIWALVVSLVLGLRMPRFPSDLGGQRLVALISAVLVLATLTSGVITSGAPSKAQGTAAPPAESQASSSPATTQAAAPTATSSTPAGASSPAAKSVSTALKLEANPSGQLAYNTKALSAKAGRVTITMANMSPLGHNVTIAQGSKVLGATPTFQGGSKTLTLQLKPGTYTFYCSVPGHRQAGMEGTLTVSS